MQLSQSTHYNLGACTCTCTVRTYVESKNATGSDSGIFCRSHYRGHGLRQSKEHTHHCQPACLLNMSLLHTCAYMYLFFITFKAKVHLHCMYFFNKLTLLNCLHVAVGLKNFSRGREGEGGKKGEA